MRMKKRLGDLPGVTPLTSSNAGIGHRMVKWHGPTEVAAEGVQAPRAAWTTQPLGHQGSFPHSSPGIPLSGSARKLDEEVGRQDPKHSAAPVLHPRLEVGQQGP